MLNTNAPTSPRLQVKGLTVTASQGQRLLDAVGFALAPKERAALLGASGAGKSMLSLALLGLLRPPVSLTHGTALLDGQDLLAMPRRVRHALRGPGIFMIFQSPGALLDPMLSIGVQLSQTSRRAGLAGPDGSNAVQAALAAVDLDAFVLKLHPQQLSGGMKQRVLIAMALVLKPRLLIADEPTSGLDDRTAHEVLCALEKAQRTLGSTMLLVTHDLRLAQAYAERALVMDAGRLVEDAAMRTFLEQPVSPAGRALREAARYLEAAE